MRNRIVVYTAIYGDKDELHEPSFRLMDSDLVCFTDSKHLKSASFDIRVYPSVDQDPVRSAKVFKVLPHWFFPDYEYSLWVDASVTFKTLDIPALIANYLRNHDMAFFAHPDRDCVYDEAEACIAAQCDDAKLIREQMEQYRDEGYPPHNGLIAGGVIPRKHLSADVIRVDEDWWAEILKFCRRDQLSFNYVAWKNKFAWATIDGKLWDNHYFRVTRHKAVTR